MLYQFAVLLTMYECSYFPQARQQSTVSNFLILDKLISEKKNLSVVLNLKFSYYERSWVSFQMFQGILFFFFNKLSFHVAPHTFWKNTGYCPFSSISRNSLKTRKIIPLWYELQIFSPFILCLCLWYMCMCYLPWEIIYFGEVKFVDQFLNGLWICVIIRKACFTSRFTISTFMA